MNKQKLKDMTILAPVKEFESEAREVAYGFMVKGYSREATIFSMVEDVKWDKVIEMGALLSHINYTKVASADLLPESVRLLNPVAVFVDSDEVYNKVLQIKNEHSLNVQIYSLAPIENDSTTSVEYLRMLGRSWERKYKPNVDRTYWQLYSPASLIG